MAGHHHGHDGSDGHGHDDHDHHNDFEYDAGGGDIKLGVILVISRLYPPQSSLLLSLNPNSPQRLVELLLLLCH